jgi:type I restriction enzyme S subunit
MSSTKYNEYLSQIPLDWQKVRIEELGSIYSGGTPSRDEPSFWDGSVAWVTPTELTALKSKWLLTTKEYITEVGLRGSSANLLPQGSLLVTTRATIGVIAIASIPVSTNQGFKSIVPNKLTDFNFYYHLLNFIAPEIVRLASGSTFDEISRKDFSSIIVPRPELSEQKIIAEILDTIDEAIARTDSLIQKLKLMKAGLLNDLLTRGLDENGELRDPIKHPEQFKDSVLGRIPKEWEVVSLKKEINIIHGYAFKGEYFSNIPQEKVILVPGNFHREGGLYFDENNTKYYTGEVPENTILNNGDLLVVMTDISPKTLILGRVVYLDIPFPVLHNQRIGKIIQNSPDKWNRLFLMLVMNSDSFRSEVISNATGTTVRHTSPDRIMMNLVPKPNLYEQTQIVEIINTHDTRIRTEETYLNKLKRQKQGLMHDLLTGKVRVT